MMASMVSQSGTVHQVQRLTTVWRGRHGEPITALDLGGTVVRYPGTPSVGVGDVVTVVGYSGAEGIRARAMRNESTDVSYAPSPWPAALIGATLLGVAAPIVGFPLAFLLVPVGAWSLMVAFRNYRVRWLLDAQPSRHASPIKAPRRATGPAPRE